MYIDPDLLIAWGAVAKKYNKNDFIFYEGDKCRFYHQVEDGHVKMCSYNEEGKVFVQGIFDKGESFGEPPLFIDVEYPACAQAETNCLVYKLSKDTLFKILAEYPQLKMQFIISFATRIYEKSTINRNIVNPHPEKRIIGLLKKFKKDHNLTETKSFIPLTRQSMADQLGLRVETIIRTLKKMEEKGTVAIIHHKLYY
ncbi:MAG: Crp/Fnr family transcriptional regulator [Saprospiraceae bacterium]